MLSILLAIVLGFIVIPAGLLLYYSPGKPEQFLGKNGKPLEGSISEKSFVTIGGIRQGMFIRSKDTRNPVLLYLHGGPAFPNYFLVEKYKPGLEDYFTVCYWEQRGGGLSYSPDVSIETMTFEQLTFDAIEVSNYLRNRFGKEKIYLMAHSGGTPIALQAVVKAPEIYHAYIAMAQITNQAESEKIAYKYITEQYTALGKTKELKELRKYPVLESDSSIIYFYQSMIRDQSMHELSIGTMREMKSVFWGVFIPVWTCKAYTIREKINIWVSKFTFIKKAKLVEQLFAYDIPNMVSSLEVPVYFFSGKYDLTVNTALSEAYFEKLKAPAKGFYIFGNSAHSPLFEEPRRVKEIIESDILKREAD
ncbi:MAG TPA: alpha/beta hydrolase [Prolixibacteraceae bacterium]|nr:alpha/beta hydrolase [Prolixibacteraceae bacterium]